MVYLLSREPILFLFTDDPSRLGTNCKENHKKLSKEEIFKKNTTDEQNLNSLKTKRDTIKFLLAVTILNQSNNS